MKISGIPPVNLSTTVDGHPTIPDSVAVQSLKNNASVKSFLDGDVKGTSNKDSALRDKTCRFVIILDITQGLASFALMNDNAFITVRRKQYVFPRCPLTLL